MEHQAYQVAQQRVVEGDGVGFHAEPESIGEIIGSTHEAWNKFNLLTLDGGGIRGYWSLLALEKLMEHIAVEEEDDDSIHCSFWPEDWPENVSHVPLTEEEERDRDNAPNTMADRHRATSKTRRYLPCHYFDYIGGSSTGALIAIMLGRFRMTVPDCLFEYERLGNEVFGKPRFFTTLNFGVGSRTKYKGTKLKKVFEDVTARRSERVNGLHARTAFPSKRGLCKTFVTTLKTDSSKKVSQLYLIRSYDHNKPTSPYQSRQTTRRTTIATSRSNTGRSGDMIASTGEQGRTRRQHRNINHEKAQDFSIWEVARAATAAPHYFEPLKIETSQPAEPLIFEDGGFNYTNNPTVEGVREIEEAKGSGSIGVVVSIGTARTDEPLRRKGMLPLVPWVKSIVQKLSSPEPIHEEIEYSAKKSPGFPYYRLNHPNGCNVELDEWKPKSGRIGASTGSTTIRAIRTAFNEWASHWKTQALLKRCAAELVVCRKERISNTAMWERYARGSVFTCSIRGCPMDGQEFYNREKFRTHLDRDHQLEEPHLSERIRDCCRFWEYPPAERN